MSFQSVLINGTTYLIPDPKQVSWGQNVTDALVALADPDNLLQPGSGTFTLTDTLNLGGAFGVKASNFSSRAASIADAGAIRLGVSDVLNWRNNADGANLSLAVNATDQLTFNGIVIETDTLPSANIFVGNASASSTAVAMTGDIGIDNAGLTSIQSDVIINADVKSDAAIALIKLATLPTSRAATTDGSGILSVSSVTTTELGYLVGVTSVIQTQLDSKAAAAAVATIALDNLASVAINTSLISDTANTDDLGSSANYWKTLFANQVLGRDGSATNPTYSFDADPNSGIYSISDNVLGISTDGAEAVRVDATGQVSIGGVAPDGTLHVHTATAGAITASNTYNDLVVENSTNAGITILTPDGSAAGFVFGAPQDSVRAGIFYSQSTDILNIDSTLDITFTTAASVRMTIEAGGTIIATGDVSLATLGKSLKVKEGANAKMGIATLVLGTLVISTTAVTAASRIQLTAQTLGTVSVPSALAVSARSVGTSFTILASDLTDTSTVAWFIVEPA